MHGDLDRTIKQKCQPWLAELQQGATSLTALSIHTGTTAPPSAFRQLPLRRLELHVGSQRSWVKPFLANLLQCSLLESLVLVRPRGRGGSPDLPNADLTGMPKLKHVKLEGWVPINGLLLPHDCQLN